LEVVSTIFWRSELGTCSKWDGVTEALARPLERERMSVT
jgi:alpha-amylase/alpha-mannosidase (GH57 family)